MFDTYLPDKFCREFVQIKRNSLRLTALMATIKGVKPFMDDWIESDRYRAYKKACKKYSLFIKPGIMLQLVTNRALIPKNIAGKNCLTSTTASFGSPFNLNKEGELRVFISKSKKYLEEGFNNSWYPVIIKDRVINKPLIDAFKYGYNLGYPSCCITFFQKHNDWSKYSYLYEAFKNTPKGNYNYLCNPFARDAYTYIYHMPCSYNCQATINLAKRVRRVIYEEELQLGEKIDMHLKLPLLVFYERKFYAFEGEIKHNKLFYKKVYFIGQAPENNLYETDLNKGNCVFIENKDILILNKGRLIKRIKGERKDFAPEFPFIIQFK